MAKTTKKRNAQDATREYDVAPIRREVARLKSRVKSLEQANETMAKQIDELRVSAVTVVGQG